MENTKVTIMIRCALFTALIAIGAFIQATGTDVGKTYISALIISKYDYIVVEGSGGIICPLFKGKNTIMLTDVIKELNLSTIVVSNSGLGSINSTLLTMEYIKSQNIKVNALFLNRYNHDEIIHRGNRNYFEDTIDIPIYICEDNNDNLNIDSERLMDLCTEI